VINAVGQDRVGIVSDITGLVIKGKTTIVDLNCMVLYNVDAVEFFFFLEEVARKEPVDRIGEVLSEPSSIFLTNKHIKLTIHFFFVFLHVVAAGGNVGESQAARLGSHFSLMMLVTVPSAHLDDLKMLLNDVPDMSSAVFETALDGKLLTPQIACT
jgi:hypothetical protein